MVRFASTMNAANAYARRRAHFQPEAFGLTPVTKPTRAPALAARGAIRIRMGPGIGTMLFSLRFAASRGWPGDWGAGRRRVVEPFRRPHQLPDVDVLVAGRAVLVVVRDHQAAAFEAAALRHRALDHHPDAIAEELGRHAAGNHVNGGGAVGDVELEIGDAVTALHGADR